MKKAWVFPVLILIAASSFADDGQKGNIYIEGTAEYTQQLFFFRDNFRAEAVTLGYNVVNNKSDAEYTFKFAITPNVIVYSDGTQRPPNSDEKQSVILISLIRNSDYREFISFSYLFTTLEEMFGVAQYLFYMAAASLPPPAKADTPPVSIAEAPKEPQIPLESGPVVGPPPLPVGEVPKEPVPIAEAPREPPLNIIIIEPPPINIFEAPPINIIDAAPAVTIFEAPRETPPAAVPPPLPVVEPPPLPTAEAPKEPQTPRESVQAVEAPPSPVAEAPKEPQPPLEAVQIVEAAPLPEDDEAPVVDSGGQKSTAWMNQWLYLRATVDCSIDYFVLLKSGDLYRGNAIYEGSIDNPAGFSWLNHKVVPVPGITLGAELQFLSFMSLGLNLHLGVWDPERSIFPNVTAGAQLKFPIKLKVFLLEPYGAFSYPLLVSSAFGKLPGPAIGGGLEAGVKLGARGAIFVDANFMYYLNNAVLRNTSKAYPNPSTIQYQHFTPRFGLGYKHGLFDRK